MKILILGATGFLAQNIVMSCLGSGYDITVSSRQLQVPKLNNFILLDELLMLESVSYDVVINGIVSYDSETCFDVNYSLSKLIFDKLDKKSLKMYITFDTFFSKYIDLCPKVEYARSKCLFNSYLSLQKASTFGIFNIILEHLYGPLDSVSKFIPMVIDNLKNNRVTALTDCLNERDFVYVKDLVDFVQYLLQHPERGYHSFEFGTGHAVSVKEFLNSVVDIYGGEGLLNFGVSDYSASLDRSCADTSYLKSKFNWTCSYDITRGLLDLSNE
ncbi:NAD(P)-dependent oxidoreductase [Porticoccaceae bacterium]|nr:NAD(P)-dependent oxidoreductase [Porticoccaceae bacterium]